MRYAVWQVAGKPSQWKASAGAVAGESERRVRRGVVCVARQPYGEYAVRPVRCVVGSRVRTRLFEQRRRQKIMPADYRKKARRYRCGNQESGEAEARNAAARVANASRRSSSSLLRVWHRPPCCIEPVVRY